MIQKENEKANRSLLHRAAPLLPLPQQHSLNTELSKSATVSFVFPSLRTGDRYAVRKEPWPSRPQVLRLAPQGSHWNQGWPVTLRQLGVSGFHLLQTLQVFTVVSWSPGAWPEVCHIWARLEGTGSTDTVSLYMPRSPLLSWSPELSPAQASVLPVGQFLFLFTF